MRRAIGVPPHSPLPDDLTQHAAGNELHQLPAHSRAIDSDSWNTDEALHIALQRPRLHVLPVPAALMTGITLAPFTYVRELHLPGHDLRNVDFVVWLPALQVLLLSRNVRLACLQALPAARELRLVDLSYTNVFSSACAPLLELPALAQIQLEVAVTSGGGEGEKENEETHTCCRTSVFHSHFSFSLSLSLPCFAWLGIVLALLCSFSGHGRADQGD